MARRPTDELRSELRWLGEVLSGARDAEVQMAGLLTLLAGQPADVVLGLVAGLMVDHPGGRAARGTPACGVPRAVCRWRGYGVVISMVRSF